MEIELRKQALAFIDMKLPEIQVVVVVLTRQLAFKVVQQLNDDVGEIKCFPCINDRRVIEHIDEIRQQLQQHLRIVVGTLSGIDLFLHRNILKMPYIKKVYLLDSIAMVYSPLKRSLERIISFIHNHFPITLHLPPSASIVKEIQNFNGNVSCYTVHPDFIEANHFAIHITNEVQKMDKLCKLCRKNTSIQILICCKTRRTACANAEMLRARNFPALLLINKMKPHDIRSAIEGFQSCEMQIMVTSGYVRGLLDLQKPMIIINYDLPKPDAYARRVNFTGDSWIARHTVFLSFIKMNERNKLHKLKEALGLRWVLIYPD